MSKLVMGQLTWPELAAELDHIKVALVPVGSCEQHGPNTTFITDAARAGRDYDASSGRYRCCDCQTRH